MLWIVTLTGQAFVGFEIVDVILRSRLDIWLEASMGIPLGLGLSSLVFFWSSVILGVTTLHVVVHTVMLFVIGYLINRLSHVHLQWPDTKTVVFAATSLCFATFFAIGCYSSHGGLMVIIRQPLLEEVSLIHSFYHGVNSGLVNIFKIRHPSCYQCTVRSRWLTALHSAMLMKGGASLFTAIKFPSLLLLFSICFLIMSVAFLYMRHIPQSVVSCLVFLFASGLGMVDILSDKVRVDKRVDCVHNRGFHTVWMHPVELILGHRPSQLSLGVATSCFLLLGSSRPSKRKYALLGLLVGVLPATQHQALIAMLLYIGLVVIIRGLAKQKVFSHVVAFGTCFGCISLLQLIHYLRRRTNTFLANHYDLATEYIEKGSYYPTLEMWFDALGLFVLVVWVFPWFVTDHKLLIAYLPSFFLFLVGNFVKFQQDAHHNVLFFYPAWMVMASIVFVASLSRVISLTSNEEVRGVLTGFVVLVVAGVTGSSIIGLARQFNYRQPLCTSEMTDTALWIAANTPRKAVFVGCPEIVETLAGKVEFKGPHAENYGFNVTGRSDADFPKNKAIYAVESDGPSCTGRKFDPSGGWSPEYERKDIRVFSHQKLI